MRLCVMHMPEVSLRRRRICTDFLMLREGKFTCELTAVSLTTLVNITLKYDLPHCSVASRFKVNINRSSELLKKKGNSDTFMLRHVKNYSCQLIES